MAGFGGFLVEGGAGFRVGDTFRVAGLNLLQGCVVQIEVRSRCQGKRNSFLDADLPEEKVDCVAHGNSQLRKYQLGSGHFIGIDTGTEDC